MQQKFAIKIQITCKERRARGGENGRSWDHGARTQSKQLNVLKGGRQFLENRQSSLLPLHHQPPRHMCHESPTHNTHTDTRAGNVIKLCYALVLFHPAPAPPPTPLPHPLRAIFAAAYAISYHVRHALCTFGKGVNGWRCGRELGTCRVANIIIFIIMTVVVTIKTITKTKVVSLHGN